jgi:hypothetical protein
MSNRVTPWFDRRFDLTFPLEQAPYIVARLRGTPDRLEDILRGVSREIRIRRRHDRWSPQEHAGHLLDLESLWLARVNDYVTAAPALTVADLTNRKTHEANHNARELNDILHGFRDARRTLLEAVIDLPTDILDRRLSHPRLRQSMRLVDHLYFAAEHDDHHLATIRELITTTD